MALPFNRDCCRCVIFLDAFARPGGDGEGGTLDDDGVNVRGTVSHRYEFTDGDWHVEASPQALVCDTADSPIKFWETVVGGNGPVECLVAVTLPSDGDYSQINFCGHSVRVTRDDSWLGIGGYTLQFDGVGAGRCGRKIGNSDDASEVPILFGYRYTRDYTAVPASPTSDFSDAGKHYPATTAVGFVRQVLNYTGGWAPGAIEDSITNFRCLDFESGISPPSWLPGAEIADETADSTPQDDLGPQLFLYDLPDASDYTITASSGAVIRAIGVRRTDDDCTAESPAESCLDVCRDCPPPQLTVTLSWTDTCDPPISPITVTLDRVPVGDVGLNCSDVCFFEYVDSESYEVTLIVRACLSVDGTVSLFGELPCGDPTAGIDSEISWADAESLCIGENATTIVDSGEVTVTSVHFG